MKHVLKSAVKVVSRSRWYAALALFVFTLLAGVFSVPLLSSRASAAGGEEYAYNYNKKDEDKINDSIGKHGGEGYLDAVYAKGGPYSEGEPVRLIPDNKFRPGSMGENVYLYRGSFKCQGYTIGMGILLELKKPIGNTDPKGMVFYTSIKGTGADGKKVDINVGEPLTRFGRYKALSNEQVSNNLEGICRPTNYMVSGGITAVNLPRQNIAINAWKGGRDAEPVPPPAAAAGTDPEGLGCDADENPLTWILCLVIDLMNDVITALDKEITKRLELETENLFCGDKTCNAFREVWVSFRNIALGLLVAAGLIVLISQALGMEILDAYTIRKILPRFLVAAIIITVSWPLMQFAANLTNDMGLGIRHLIYAPFSKLSDAEVDISFGEGIMNSIIGTAGVAAGVPLWIRYGGIGVLFSYVGTAALAVFIALFIIELRDVLLILLMLVAPVAIMLYILPNTQKGYRLWSDSFIKLLLMFPLIAAFIATGRVFAAVSLSSGEGGFNQLAAVIGYFGPYFLIPLTFKFAGGAMRQIGGLVNDRSRGAFDGLRNYRKERAKQRTHAARTGGLYRNEFGEFKVPGMDKRTSIGKMANALGTGGLDIDEAAPYWMGRAGIPGFRRNPRVVDDVLSSQAVEHSANLAKKAGLHYEGAWGIMGKRQDQYGKGLKWSDETEQKLVDAGFYGQAAKNGGEKVWQVPTGDAGVRKLADILQDDGVSDTARRAGINLAASAEKFGTFKSDDETRRADIETAALMTAASQGRLEDEDYVKAYNGVIDKPGLMYPGFNKKFAAKRQKAMLDMAQGSRAEQRDGKLITFDNEKGRAQSAFDKRTWKKDDTRTHDPYGYHKGGVYIPSDQAVDNVTTLKGQALISAKGETIQRSGDAIAYLAGAGKDPGQLTIEEQSWRQQIVQGFANSYDDAGSREAWLEVGRKAGMTDEDLNKYNVSTMDPVQLERMRQGDGKKDGGEPAGGPTPT